MILLKFNRYSSVFGGAGAILGGAGVVHGFLELTRPATAGLLSYLNLERQRAKRIVPRQNYGEIASIRIRGKAP